VPHVELYTRKGCHLCDVAKDALDRVRATSPFELTIIDVDTNAELVALYGLEVPVILVDGLKHAKFRVDEAALQKRLEAARLEAAHPESAR
jgi:glutaredoxin